MISNNSCLTMGIHVTSICSETTPNLFDIAGDLPSNTEVYEYGSNINPHLFKTLLKGYSHSPGSEKRHFSGT